MQGITNKTGAGRYTTTVAHGVTANINKKNFKSLPQFPIKSHTNRISNIQGHLSRQDR
jgi:hypothetical protein